jgi:hypothetical protein
MAHVVVRVAYMEYVMPAKQALEFVELLAKAERFEKKFNNETKGYTFHVFPDEQEYTMSVINENVYNTAKLAGKPE